MIALKAFLQSTLTGFWHHRHLIRQLVAREIRARYRASFLGFLWSLIMPLSLLAIYTFVFSVIFRSTWPGNTFLPFSIILFAGLIPYTLFSDVLNRSPMLVLNNRSYVKKVVFPLPALSVVAVGTAFVDSLITLSLLLIGVLVFARGLTWMVLLLPVVYIPLLLISLGLSWFLSSLGVYIRDVGPMVNIFTRLLFFLTPIVYSIERVPERFRWVMALNPLAFIVDAFRDVLLWGISPAWTTWLIWSVLGLLISGLGYLWFNLTRKGFADVI